MVLAHVLCRAGACTEHLLNPTSQGKCSPSIPILAWHPHKQCCKTHHHYSHALQHTVGFTSYLQSYLFTPLCHCRYFLSCRTVQYLQKNSIQQCQREWTNVTSQTHQSAPDLHPAPSYHKLWRGRKGIEIKREPIQEHFKSPFITCFL